MNIISNINQSVNKVTHVKNPYARFGLKWFVRLLGIVMVGFLIIFFFTMAYVSANKDKIVNKITGFVNGKIQGNVAIGNVDVSFFKTFPFASIELQNVEVTDTMVKQHGHPFLKANDVLFSLNVFQLLGKGFPVRGIKLNNAEIFMYTDSSGYSNQYLMKPRKDTSVSPPGGNNQNSFALKEVTLNNVNWILLDERKHKYHNILADHMNVRIAKADSGLAFNINANNLVKNLSFNTLRGSYLKEKTFEGKFKLNLNTVANTLSFKDIDVKIAKQPFRLTGLFDLGQKNPQFNIDITTKKVTMEEAKDLLTAKIDSALGLVKLNKPIDVRAELQGPLKGGDPLIVVNGKAVKTDLATPFFDFTDATFEVMYTNEVVKGIPRKDSNSVIRLTNFTARWHNLNVLSKEIEILNLTKPKLKTELSSNFDLKEMNEFTNSLDFTHGRADVLLNYEGPIERNNQTNSFLNGHIVFMDGKVNYVPRNIDLSSVNGKIFFKNSNVEVENINTVVFGNNIRMRGTANNALSLINSQPNAIRLDWYVNAQKLNLQPFTTLLKKRGGVKNRVIKNQTLNDVAVKIDRLLEQSSIDANFNIGNLLFKKFNAQNVNANISILQDRYLLNNVSFTEGGGSMKLNGALVGNGNGHNASVKVNTKNVDVGNLFAAFENFGQSAVLNSNIDGKLTADVNASLNLDNEGKVMPGTTNGVVDFQLLNGSLKDFEPFKKIQTFVFNDRDFRNVRFAELKNKITIRNGEITIPRMEINSNVLQLFVEGLYSTKGNTDLSIQVPVKNVTKKDPNKALASVGTDASGGSSIFLRGRPKADGSIGFKLDLFNKFKKEKDKPEKETRKNRRKNNRP